MNNMCLVKSKANTSSSDDYASEAFSLMKTKINNLLRVKKIHILIYNYIYNLIIQFCNYIYLILSINNVTLFVTLYVLGY